MINPNFFILPIAFYKTKAVPLGLKVGYALFLSYE